MARFFWLVWRFLTHRWTRYAAAWIAALGIAGWQQYLAQQAFRNRETDSAKIRPDGNEGQTSIDFGGQGPLGRTLHKGYGRYLYDRNHQFEVAQAGYPRERERPAANEHDAENLVINWFVD